MSHETSFQDEVETWKNYGTPFLPMITHGGKANTVGCKIIFNEVISDKHNAIIQNITYSSKNCNLKDQSSSFWTCSRNGTCPKKLN